MAAHELDVLVWPSGPVASRIDPMVRTQIRLDKDQYERLKALAAKHSQSLSFLVRKSVTRFLDETERAEAWDRLMEAGGRLSRSREETGRVHASRRLRRADLSGMTGVFADT